MTRGNICHHGGPERLAQKGSIMHQSALGLYIVGAALVLGVLGLAVAVWILRGVWGFCAESRRIRLLRAATEIARMEAEITLAEAQQAKL